MLLCTYCLHTDDRQNAHCPQCGGASLANLTRNGDVTTVPADAGMPCAACGEVDRELKMRYYRRVVGMLIVDQTWATVGYYCGRCRRRQFASNKYARRPACRYRSLCLGRAANRRATSTIGARPSRWSALSRRPGPSSLRLSCASRMLPPGSTTT
jgi:hypothetical protein